MYNEYINFSLQAAICDSNISKLKNKQTIKEQEKQIKELNTQKKSLVYNLKLLKEYEKKKFFL